ncbi:MAG: tripartite tricarboxylate transporter permease [Desulfobacterales bacterium]|nr:tripartite tricarboxylate transporter permease [Desulfobacterales bacterium]
MADFFGALILLVGDPLAVVLFFAALITGLLFAAMPGINMITLGAIILPFTSYLDASHAVMIYGVIYVAGTYGGAVMAILFNIPGSPENAPTALDGYPMTLKGQSGKAIGAAVMSSALGGTISAIVMMIAAPPISRWACSNFGPTEMFALIFFGLCVASSVGAENQWKGYLSVGLGLLIATVGTDPADGTPRYVFGTYYLYAGIHFIPLILGFFAITEVFVQGKKMVLASCAYQQPKIGLNFPKWYEFWNMRWTIVRSWILGFFSGILPGIGAILAAFLSYNVAVRISKHPETFGKGELEGVVASETANNAATGGAMIPLLALGLPGGAITAMMMAVLMMHGIEPGPTVMVTNKSLVWVVFVAMLLANLSIFILGYIETRTVCQLLRIPFRILAPAILILSAIGCYALRNIMVDIWVMFIAGVLGFFLRTSGYSIPSLILGVILGSLGESFFVKSIQLMNFNWWGFLQSPISAVLIIGGFAAVTLNAFSAFKKSFSRNKA